jgi:hypothetical protein
MREMPHFGSLTDTAAFVNHGCRMGIVIHKSFKFLIKGKDKKFEALGTQGARNWLIPDSE